MSVVEKPIAYADVRESIAVAKSHGEKFFEQIVWQVENEVWTILGYGSWDELREAEYADLGVVAPRADRPELVTRLRAKGLTQRQIADTVGVSQQTVSRLNTQMSNENAPATITNSRGQERPATYTPRPVPTFDATPDWDPVGVNTETGEVHTKLEPKEDPYKPPRRPLTDQFRDASVDLRKITERLERLVADDRFPRNREQVALKHQSDLSRASNALAKVIDALNNN